jgi:nicotinate-nucleotide--dimethylbenzimidazole phosphoribosyltransferase
MPPRPGPDGSVAHEPAARSWERPVPLVGDTTSAAERAAFPAGWAVAPAQRDALYDVMRARRDVRRFRPDAVPDDVLVRLLEAAHLAPSVGHSQPWRFVVVRSAATRERAALCAEREQLRQAEMLDDVAGRQMRDLQLHGIREAPLGIVVCCDRRVAPAAVLGRATFRDADVWSCACAIENLWLAARAEGLGLGWVTLFPPQELAELVGLPGGVIAMGWLCVGWPDERPPAPGLERAGWSSCQPLAGVVFDECWPATGDRLGPAPPPGATLRGPAPEAVVAARDEADELLTPPGSFGALDRVLARLRSLGVTSASEARLVLAGSDHPVTAHGVTTFPASVTREVLEAALAGDALGAVAARSAGAELAVVDSGVLGPPVHGALAARPTSPRGDLVNADAMSRNDAERLVRLGERAARRKLVLLGEVGIGNTTVATALFAALSGWSPEQAARVVGLGASGDSPTLRRKAAAVRGAVGRARAEHGQSLREDPLRALASLGGPELAVLTGVTLGAARRGSAVVLDGFATGVSALVAARLDPAVAAHLIAGQMSAERAHRSVLVALGLEAVLDLRLRAGEGLGASLATVLLRAALATREQAGRVARAARPGSVRPE